MATSPLKRAEALTILYKHGMFKNARIKLRPKILKDASAKREILKVCAGLVKKAAAIRQRRVK